MLAHAVEAHRLGQLHVFLQRRVVGCGQQRVGPVALVQHQAQRVGPAVEHEAVAQDVHRAQRGVTLEFIKQLVLAPQPHLGVQQRRPLGRPEQFIAVVVDAGVGQADGAVHFALDHLVAVVRQQPVALTQHHLDLQVLVRLVAHHARREADRKPLHMRRPAQLVDVSARHPLQPHRLPDAGGARVPDRMRLELPVLLAARLGQLVRVVFGQHGHALLARGVEHRGDVGPERRVPALVRGDQPVVHPHLGLVVHRAEAQDDAAAIGHHVEIALVPHRRVEAAVEHAAGPRLGRKRHLDLVRPLAHVRGPGMAPVVVETEAPGAIERGPLRAPQLRPGVAPVARLHHAQPSGACRCCCAIRFTPSVFGGRSQARHTACPSRRYPPRPPRQPASWSRSTGLVRWWSKPACSARRLSSGWP